MKEFAPKNADTIVNANKSYSFGKILELNFISYRFHDSGESFSPVFSPFNKSIIRFSGPNIEINSITIIRNFSEKIYIQKKLFVKHKHLVTFNSEFITKSNDFWLWFAILL